MIELLQDPVIQILLKFFVLTTVSIFLLWGALVAAGKLLKLLKPLIS